MRIVYLHGFASGPSSSKAQFFRAKFAERGIAIEIPQLDQGHFEALTITGQLSVIDRTVGGDETILMGSSLGGYLAALYAARHSNIQRLILLAPAFQFPSRWHARYTPEQLDQWKSRGSWPVFHYAYGRELDLGYELMDDSLLYEDEPQFTQPCLIFHGIQDPVVPIELSRRMRDQHPNVSLVEFDSGHELTDVLDLMWAEVHSALGLAEIHP